MESSENTLFNAEVFKQAESTLRAIQEIPSLKHTPVLDRINRDRDVALETCIDKATLHLSEITKRRVLEELFEFGPLHSAIGDDDVTEILILSPEVIWLERKGKLIPHSDRFLNHTTFRSFVHRLTREARTNTDETQPFANGRWRDFRVHVAGLPIVSETPNITLRRIRNKKWSLDELRELGWVDDSGRKLLEKIVDEKSNVLVVGATGAGKTSALSACLNATGSNERILLIEDTDEIAIPNAVSTKLLSKPARVAGDTEFGLGDLLKHCLRMRPDRIVMGEVRGGEAKDLLMAFATGHRGCWGTLHAATPREALLRLEMLVQMGAPQWTTHTVRSLIHSSIDFIVVAEKDEDGKRRLGSIHQVASLEDIGFCFSTLYRHGSNLTYARTSTKLPLG
ncbi:MAG: CpaF family protein [Deltaproteobacteria bacterium]|jgi:pilus assembly protein CpaF|nr:CpaF family protein [Deltaproteobacteria bacterium]